MKVREREREGGYFFKVKMGRTDPIFLWWELSPNMQGMQSLKALVLFVEEQCQYFAATTPSLILCPHPLLTEVFVEQPWLNWVC